MEEQCSPLGLAYYYQEEGFVEELKHSLLYSTLELEAAVISAHEEISRKDDEILQLRGLIEKIVKEKDDFEAKCRQLVLEKHLLLQGLSNSSKQHLESCPSSSNTTSNQEENPKPRLPASNSGDNDDNNNSVVAPSPSEPPQPSIRNMADSMIPIKKPLPEKGKFLQAIVAAGPLLQTLLLAGPLPQWQHPPPQLNSSDIPPVKIFPPATKILLQDSCLNSPSTSSGLTNKDQHEGL